MGTDLFKQGIDREDDSPASTTPVVTDPTGSLSLSRTVTSIDTGPKVPSIPEPDPELLALFAPHADGDFDADGVGDRPPNDESDSVDDWQDLLDDSIPVRSLTKKSSRSAPELTDELQVVESPGKRGRSKRKRRNQRTGLPPGAGDGTGKAENESKNETKNETKNRAKKPKRNRSKRGRLGLLPAALARPTADRGATAPFARSIDAIKDAGGGPARTGSIPRIDPTLENDPPAPAETGATPVFGLLATNSEQQSEPPPGRRIAVDEAPAGPGPEPVSQLAALAKPASARAADEPATSDTPPNHTAASDTAAEHAAETGPGANDTPTGETVAEDPAGNDTPTGETVAEEPAGNDTPTGDAVASATAVPGPVTEHVVPEAAAVEDTAVENSAPARSASDGTRSPDPAPEATLRPPGQTGGEPSGDALPGREPQSLHELDVGRTPGAADAASSAATKFGESSILAAAPSPDALEQPIDTEVRPLATDRSGVSDTHLRRAILLGIATVACLAVIAGVLVRGESSDGGTETAADTEELAAEDESAAGVSEPAASSTTSTADVGGDGGGGGERTALDRRAEIAAADRAQQPSSTTERNDSGETSPVDAAGSTDTPGEGTDGTGGSTVPDAEGGGDNPATDSSTTMPDATSTSASTPTSATGSTTCSGVTWNPVLDEGFDGSTLDTGVWAISGGSAGQGVQQPSSISVADGALNITAQMEGDTLVSGGVEHLGSQQYGRYEVQVRTDQDPDGVMSGTIQTAGADGNHTVYSSAGVSSPGSWHTMVVEWTPTAVKYLVDGGLVRTVEGGVPEAAQTLSIRYDASGPTIASNVTMQIDHVKIWAYGGGC